MQTIKKQDFGKQNWVILLLFGLMGQIAWTVENMFFNVFVFEEIAQNLDMITLMVQLSGVVATVATLIAGTLSDKIGNRRRMIAYGYIIWGVTVALFGQISEESMGAIFHTSGENAIFIALLVAIVGDCVMTLFGSSANDAAFNAWVTDNTKEEFRGKVEGILATLPLISMLIVVGGLGMIVELIGGYSNLFMGLGILISGCGIAGLFLVKDNPMLEKKGNFADIIYGFKPSVIKAHKPLYLVLVITAIYGIACQVFMPYIIIFMKTFLGFDVIEYSVVFGGAIIAGAALNIWFGRKTDSMDKAKLLYAATIIFAAGLIGMWACSYLGNHVALLIVFGLFGFVMIAGYILVLALSGALTRDYTPEEAVGKMQGIRMIFSVLLPMVLGPMIGNGVNALRNVSLPSSGAQIEGLDAMTTKYIPAPEIFLVGAIVALLMFAVIPYLVKVREQEKNK